MHNIVTSHAATSSLEVFKSKLRTYFMLPHGCNITLASFLLWFNRITVLSESDHDFWHFTLSINTKIFTSTFVMFTR